jgi:hypothetical protein
MTASSCAETGKQGGDFHFFLIEAADKGSEQTVFGFAMRSVLA